MVTFAPGDRVHLAGLGTGIVREVRSSGRYVVEIKGRSVVAAGDQLEPASGRRARPAKAARAAASPPPSASRGTSSPSIDLHGKTVDEALEALEVFINDALLGGSREVRVIHGGGGGRLKTAVHRYFRQLPAIAAARLDPHNPGVTIVTFS
jgi:dsDNA-specific endonuclease/ATPase MutS2